MEEELKWVCKGCGEKYDEKVFGVKLEVGTIKEGELKEVEDTVGPMCWRCAIAYLLGRPRWNRFD